MKKKEPYQTIQSRYVTEKATLLETLQNSESNRCLKRFEKPKVLFLVDRKANKSEIARAFETIYAEKRVKVTKVNTINVKPKKRRVRGRLGYRSGFKKAVLTLSKGDAIDEAV